MTKEKYTQMQVDYYNNQSDIMNVQNHRGHDKNPDYWDILLKPFSDDDCSDKIGLDFGCGCGRNVQNVLEKYNILEMHGCDLSEGNVKNCFDNLEKTPFDNYDFFVTDGQTLKPAKSDYYDIIISTIVLQHICVYEIRKSILTDMFRCLKKDGILSFQMGYGTAHKMSRDYYDNFYEAKGTNSECDTRVTDPMQVIGDLEEIGFESIEYQIRKSHQDRHDQWIFFNCKKPV